MKINKKLIWYSLPVLVGGLLIYKQFRKKQPSGGVTGSTGIGSPTGVGGLTGSTGIGGSASSNDFFPLKKGSKGQNVRDLQELMLKINNKLLPRYGADGDFGSETEAAVVSLLNKKTVEYSDYTALQNQYNQKAFPYATPKSGGGLFNLF